MNSTELDGALLADAMRVFRAALVEHEATINQLNVFPVPDGDTGTNLRSTVEAVTAALEGASNDEDIFAAISDASLLGARGNSGIILSQFLRAFVAALGHGAGPQGLAMAYREAADAARNAVGTPKEGTVLSVATAAAEGALLKASEATSVDTVARIALEWANEALARTPSQLPVLAEAGVVDAGGAGLTLFYGAMLAVLCPSVLAVELDLPAETRETLTRHAGHGALEATAAALGARPSYEVMFLFEADEQAVDQLRIAWERLGESIAIVGDVPRYSCHVHTADVGAAIEAGIGLGRLSQIRVTDLDREVQARSDHAAWGLGERPGSPGTFARQRPDAMCATVAVANGAGLERVLRSLGVAQVIEAGAAMNPSTRELLRAIECAGAPGVVLLANDKDVLEVARVAAGLATNVEVEVIETSNPAQAVPCLLRFDPKRSAADNADEMRQALRTVATGELKRTSRDAVVDGVHVRRGEFLGVSAGRVAAHGEGLVDTTVALIGSLASGAEEIVTIYTGAAFEESELGPLLEALEGAHPDLAIEPVDGGQESSVLLISLE